MISPSASTKTDLKGWGMSWKRKWKFGLEIEEDISDCWSFGVLCDFVFIEIRLFFAADDWPTITYILFNPSHHRFRSSEIKSQFQSMAARSGEGEKEEAKAATTECDAASVRAAAHRRRTAAAGVYDNQVSMMNRVSSIVCAGIKSAEIRLCVNIHLILIRTIAPLVLAQLLIQFQKPIADEQLFNGTSAVSNGSLGVGIDRGRPIRSAFDVRDAVNGEQTADRLNLFAPDYAVGESIGSPLLDRS